MKTFATHLLAAVLALSFCGSALAKPAKPNKAPIVILEKKPIVIIERRATLNPIVIIDKRR